MSHVRLKPKMTSLLRSWSDRLTNNSNSEPTKPRPDGFLTAKTTDALFTRTTPAIDGEECLHDCETCTIKYPRKFSIEEDDKLYGEIKGWNRHLLVATGKTDWVRDVEDEPASVMAAVGRHRDQINNGKLMLSASDIPLPDHHSSDPHPYGPDRPTRVLLLPAWTFIDNVTPNTISQVITSIINHAPTNTQRLPPPTNPLLLPDSSFPTLPPTNSSPSDLPSNLPNNLPSNLPSNLLTSPCPHKALILLCSQATRDARCGQSAPLLRRELERHLRPLGLYRDLHDTRPGGVGIYFISHVGGHKYSANMLVYRRAEGASASGLRNGVGGAGAGAGDVGNVDGLNGHGETNGRLNGNAKGGGGVENGEAMQCIWLARIRPEDCENVVRYTVLQGKVVKPDSQLRGGFDREKGVVSW